MRVPGTSPIAVSENLSWHQLASIEVNAPDLPGASIEVGQRRRYTQGRNCSHIIGYVAVPSEKDLTSSPFDPLLELPDAPASASSFHANESGNSISDSDREVVLSRYRWSKSLWLSANFLRSAGDLTADRF